MDIPIKDVMRAQSVKRWHIVDTARDQSVAEHSFNVCMIAQAIMRHLGLEENVMYNVVTRQALAHDLQEIYHGDPPSTGSTMVVPEEWYDQLVKAADIMDAAWFIRNYGIGEHAEKVSGRLDDRVFAFIQRIPDGTLSSACIDVWNMIRTGEHIINPGITYAQGS